MKNAILRVRTSKVGSDVERDTGIPVDEWQEMSDEQQTEVMNELVWELIDCYVVAEE